MYFRFTEINIHMDFMLKCKDRCGYQLQFSEESGLCLSIFKEYKALIVFGTCISWCECDGGNLDYTSIVADFKEHSYVVVSNINCWDLLTILESDYNRNDELIELCYPLPETTLAKIQEENEFSDD